jgi:CubicO group peptidase (beta-lactamase class C family)
MKKISILVFILSAVFIQTSDASNSAKYEALLKNYINANEPGMAVIVEKNGKILFSDAHGMANLELAVPLNTQHVFSIGSISKEFTATAIIMLLEQGKLKLQDDIHKYVPDFPTEEHKVTIEHLLTHTSGIANYTENENIWHNLITTPATLDEMLKEFTKDKMHFAPGQAMRYSNTGYMLLGKIIEVVSGQTYAEFIQKNIFQKLGMNNSQSGGLQLIKNRVAGYSKVNDGFSNAKLFNMNWFYAAGSLVSTVEDLAKWNRALTHCKIISCKNYQQMISPFTLNDGRKSEYGYGLSNTILGEFQAVWHGGSVPGFANYAVYFPERDIYIAVLSNADTLDPNYIAHLLSAEALGITMPEFKPAEVNDLELKALMGRYELPSKSTRTLSMENGKIYAQRDDYDKWQVIPMSPNSFYYQGSLTYFVIEKDESGNMLMNFYGLLDEVPSVAIKKSNVLSEDL